MKFVQANVLAITALAWSSTGQAQEPQEAQGTSQVMVSATDAEGLLKVLKASGYKADLEKGKLKEIVVETSDGPISVLFSDCNEAIPDFCETLVLSASWNRVTPISDSAVTAANSDNKYVSVFRSDNGDPSMQWAILTNREGIPASVFLEALKRFISIANEFSDAAFEGDPEPEDTKEEASEESS